jgi:exodeoxyribonuclease-3
MTLNANGIRAAVRKGLWDFVAEHRPDLVCLQEVRAHRADLPPLPAGYAAHWHLAERKGYSGVGVVTRLPVERVVPGLGVDRYDREGRVLRVDLEGVTLLNVYVPSGTTGASRQAFKMRFLRRLRRHLRALLTLERELLVVGDINIAHRPIDLARWRQNQRTSGFLPEERRYLDDLLSLGLRDTVRELAGPDRAVYSWWSTRSGARARNVGWRLDYHFCTAGLHARARAHLVPREPVLSDHAPVLVDYAV